MVSEKAKRVDTWFGELIAEGPANQSEKKKVPNKGGRGGRRETGDGTGGFFS